MEGLAILWTGHLSLTGHTRNVHIFKSRERAGMKILPLCAYLCCFKAEVRLQLCLLPFFSNTKESFQATDCFIIQVVFSKSVFSYRALNMEKGWPELCMVTHIRSSYKAGTEGQLSSTRPAQCSHLKPQLWQHQFPADSPNRLLVASQDGASNADKAEVIYFSCSSPAWAPGLQQVPAPRLSEFLSQSSLALGLSEPPVGTMRWGNIKPSLFSTMECLNPSFPNP